MDNVEEVANKFSDASVAVSRMLEDLDQRDAAEAQRLLEEGREIAKQAGGEKVQEGIEDVLGRLEQVLDAAGKGDSFRKSVQAYGERRGRGDQDVYQSEHGMGHRRGRGSGRRAA